MPQEASERHFPFRRRFVTSGRNLRADLLHEMEADRNHSRLAIPSVVVHAGPRSLQAAWAVAKHAFAPAVGHAPSEGEAANDRSIIENVIPLNQQTAVPRKDSATQVATGWANSAGSLPVC